MSEKEYNKLPFWSEYVSSDIKETSKFLREMFGWKAWSTSGDDTY
jgi:predicted enzyme related to lactoylglutathione lyase